MKPLLYGRRTRGLTLIEVLVCLTIIGILIALLIPAVHAGREAGRGLVCRNNLRQLGLALHGYVSDVGVFPAGQNGRGYSLHAMVLPYLGLVPLYDSINFDTDSFEREQTTVLSTRVEGFLCPSDPPLFQPANSYAGNEGSGARDSRDGLFLQGHPAPRWIGPRDIRDGAANTAAMSEWLMGEYDGIDRRRSVYLPLDLQGPSADSATLKVRCRALDRMIAGPPSNRKGDGWITGAPLKTTYNHFMRINEPSCLFVARPNDVFAVTAGSGHSGGANVLMVDGHVRFVNEAIDAQIWSSISTRTSGEALPGGW